MLTRVVRKWHLTEIQSLFSATDICDALSSDHTLSPCFLTLIFYAYMQLSWKKKQLYITPPNGLHAGVTTVTTQFRNYQCHWFIQKVPPIDAMFWKMWPHNSLGIPQIFPLEISKSSEWSDSKRERDPVFQLLENESNLWNKSDLKQLRRFDSFVNTGSKDNLRQTNCYALHIPASRKWTRTNAKA